MSSPIPRAAMPLNRFDVILFLLACGAALALLHLVVTYRDRGSLTAASAAVAVGKGLLIVGKLLRVARMRVDAGANAARRC